MFGVVIPKLDLIDEPLGLFLYNNVVLSNFFFWYVAREVPYTTVSIHDFFSGFLIGMLHVRCDLAKHARRARYVIPGTNFDACPPFLPADPPTSFYTNRCHRGAHARRRARRRRRDGVGGSVRVPRRRCELVRTHC